MCGDTSIWWVILLVLLAGVGGMVGGLLLERAIRPCAPEDAPQRDEVLRLRLAQHWARGALLSQAQEHWRPMCECLAIAAAGCRSMAELGALLRAQVGLAGSDPQVANVWRQALGEYAAADTGAGLTVVNSSDWPHDALLTLIRQRLEAVQAQAEQIVAPPTQSLIAPDGSQ